MVPSSSGDVTRAMRGQLEPRSQNYLRPNDRERGEVILNVLIYVLIFKRRFIAKKLSALPAVFSLIWTSLCFVLAWLFILLPFIGFYEV